MRTLVIFPGVHRSYRLWLVCGLVWFGVWGCATVSQVQYFEVVGKPDPVTGIAPKSYYRMTVRGYGGGGVKYKMRAAYVSASTLDLMNGKLPTLPDADMPKESVEAYQRVKKFFLEAVEKYASQKREADEVAVSPQNHEKNVIELARQAWFTSLSDQDIISMGQLQSSDPYRFRKLVFYASATNLNLSEYDTQVNSMIDKTASLIEGLKQRKELDQQRRDQQRAGMRGQVRGIAGMLPSDSPIKKAMELFLESYLPDEPEDGQGKKGEGGGS